MMMDDDNLLDVKKKLSHYLPFLKGSNKEDISIRDILLHQAKLLTWIPFYKSTLVGLDTFNLIDHRIIDTTALTLFQFVSQKIYI
jgi:CubicO group peptidase (beta-lactamase class C family)